MTEYSRIQLRQDTAANWTAANTLLARGERALDLTSGRQKLGDGLNRWNTLPYETAAEVEAEIAAQIPTAAADAVTADLGGRQFTWEDAGGGMGYAAVGGIAIGDPRAWPASTMSGLAGRPFDIPESFGVGVGTGGNDAAAFVAARASGYVLALRPGRTYRFTSNANIGTILNWGGVIQVDSGVTVVFDDVIGPDNRVAFTGTGIARSAINRFSVGWYGNGDLSDAWDFCRRGFRQHYRQTVIIPTFPDGTGGFNWWNHSRPLEFGDPENLTIFKVDNVKIRASAPMDQQFLFSPTAKTEDVHFEGKVELDGMGFATHGVLVRGGARIRFLNELSVYNHLRDGVRLKMDADGVRGGIDQFYINFLRAVGYGAGGESGWALNIIGGNVIQGPKVENIFCNGISEDYAGDAANIGVVNIEGFVMSPQIGLITENSGTTAEGQTGLAKFPTAANLVRIAAGNHNPSSSYRAPQGVNIGSIFSFKHNYNVLKVENGGAGATKPNFTVGMLDRYTSSSNSDHIADIDFCYNSSINLGRAVASLGVRAMKVGSAATSLSVNGIRPLSVENTSGVWDGFVANGAEGFETTVADDAVVSFKPRQTNGILHVKFGLATSGYAIIAWRNDGQVIVLSKAPDIEVRTGDVLTGTTGTDGRGVISVVNGATVYFENRLGSSRALNARFV